jgi:hypothetical protein
MPAAFASRHGRAAPIRGIRAAFSDYGKRIGDDDPRGPRPDWANERTANAGKRLAILPRRAGGYGRRRRGDDGDDRHDRPE